MTDEEMTAAFVTRELVAEMNDPVSRSKLTQFVSAVFAFCCEPETFPAFIEWYASAYDDNPEVAEDMRKMRSEDLSHLSLATMSCIDRKKTAELIAAALEAHRNAC